MKVWLGVAVVCASFITMPSFGQCPSCDAKAPELDCPLRFDGNSVIIPTFNQLACRAQSNAEYGESDLDTCRRTFGPPFILVDYSIEEISSNNGTFTVDRYAAETDLEYEKQIDQAYKEASELAGKYGDTEAQAKLDKMRENHLKIALKYKTNKDVIELKTEAAGHGWAFDRKRGWQDTAVIARVACILPVNLRDQIMAEVKVKGDLVAIRNQTGKSIYAHHAHVEDSSASCDSAKNAATIRLNPTQSESYTIPVTNGKAGKLCVRYYSSKPDKPSLSKSCEYSPGPINEIASLPAKCTN